MGTIVARDVFGIATPRIGLLNIGEEDTKGHELIQEAHELIRATSGLNYLGFVEGNHIFDENVDVVVTDGFTGNVALKAMEGLAKLIVEQLRTEFSRNLTSKLSGLLARPVLRRVGDKLDPRRYNGACMVGLTAVVVKSTAARTASLSPRPSTRPRSRCGVVAGRPSRTHWRRRSSTQKRASMYSRIAGTGSYLPEKIVTNFDLEKRMDTTDEWIRTRTGIERRHIAAEGQTTVDIARIRRAPRHRGRGRHAGRDRLHRVRHHHARPRVSQLRHAAAGAPRARVAARRSPSRPACSGFIYALSIADKFVKAGEAKCALVVGAENALAHHQLVGSQHRGVVWRRRGAVVLKPSAEPGIMSTHLHSDGAYKDLLYVDSGVSKGFNIDPATNKVDIGIKMAGQRSVQGRRHQAGGAVGRSARRQRPGEVRGELADPAPGEHPHHRAMAKRLDLPDGARHRHRAGSRQHLDRLVPLALDTGVPGRPRERGDLLLLEAVGGALRGVRSHRVGAKVLTAV
jgi:3-oxoacyl-[acyl-carrier-protein] synthase-3